ncbi:MAG TPA: cyclic nucleotide-binding domain-containing protein [Vicinamibacteria bacterium]|nr:cyclic nucleotide-binding domain-containing protein [Vicinamibacteria bacterium]
MSHISPIHFELLPPVPAISLVHRLKEIPLFRFTSMDELFRIATISRQVRYAADVRVQERGAPADYIQVLVQGRFRLDDGREKGSEILVPPAMLGFQEVLKGTALQSSAVSETESIALVMPAEEFRTLLAANIELAQGLFRMLLGATGNGGGTAPAARTSSVRYEHRAAPLKTVEKVMYLQTVPILSHATAEELYEVAAIAREIGLVETETLFSAGAPASIVLLLAGAIELSSSAGASQRVESGACIGVRETLAGVSFLDTARVVAPGRALQIDREPLFDLLADRMDLLQGVFSAVFHSKGGSPVGP